MWMRLSEEDLEALKLLVAFAGSSDYQWVRDAAERVEGRIKHYADDPGDPRYLEAARLMGRDGELEFDEDAVISEGEDPGAYVMGWVWVASSDAGICRTEGCDGDPNNGEGWDGYCGNCADRLDGAEEEDDKA